MITSSKNFGKLLLKSGFEPGTRGLPLDAHEILAGKEDTSALYDWDSLRHHLPSEHPHATPASGEISQTPADDNTALGYFDFHYLGGTAEQRFARIIEDPTRPGNHVLHFCIHQANEKMLSGGYKARIQANIYQNQNITAVSSRVSMYLHPDLNVLHDWEPGFDWLTLQEYWFNPRWGNEPYPFRISLNLSRDPGKGKKELHFYVHGQPEWEKGTPVHPGSPGWGVPTWQQINRDFAVPTGRWLECETIYQMGDDTTGRFVYRVRMDGGPWIDVFDITNWTYNPKANKPTPLYGWSPMKLYTSSALVDFVRQQGGVMQLYWDNLEIRSR